MPTISIVGGTAAAAGEFSNIVILLFYSKLYLKFCFIQFSVLYDYYSS